MPSLSKYARTCDAVCSDSGMPVGGLGGDAQRVRIARWHLGLGCPGPGHYRRRRRRRRRPRCPAMASPTCGPRGTNVSPLPQLLLSPLCLTSGR